MNDRSRMMVRAYIKYRLRGFLRLLNTHDNPDDWKWVKLTDLMNKGERKNESTD